MKTTASVTFATLSCAWLFAAPAQAGDAPSPQNARIQGLPTETNSVPQSIFSIPASPTQGRDPFYPNARYYMGGGGEIKHTPIPSEADTLELKAVSGSTDHRLAMIAAGGTNRTLAVGEETEFRTSSGRMRVRCVDIKGESAVIEVDGDRRELHLRD